MKKYAVLSTDAKIKDFGIVSRVWVRVQRFFHEQRMEFVIGLTKERFAFAMFYVNGRADLKQAKDFGDLQSMVRHYCELYHLKNVSDFMLLKMWCSRKLIKFSSNDIRIEIVTYWHF